MAGMDFKKELLALEWAGAEYNESGTRCAACPKCRGVKPGQHGFITYGHKKSCLFNRIRREVDTGEQVREEPNDPQQQESFMVYVGGKRGEVPAFRCTECGSNCFHKQGDKPSHYFCNGCDAAYEVK